MCSGLVRIGYAVLYEAHLYWEEDAKSSRSPDNFARSPLAAQRSGPDHVYMTAEDDPATANVSEFAKQYGFSEFGRFAGTYRTMFGETPSTTLLRAQITRP